MIAIVDEFTRECLALEPARSLPAFKVKRILARLFKGGRMPKFIRSDNGPEFIEAALRRWFGRLGVKTLFIRPGSPWENVYAESFMARLRDEFLDRELFESILEVKILAQQFRKEYNEVRPHSGLRYLTPAAFAAEFDGGGSSPLHRIPGRPGN